MSSIGHCFTTCFSENKIRSVEIHASFRKGLFRFDIIGLPKSMIREGRDRILSALHQMGLSLPGCRLLVSLNPSDIPKEGSHFDLPILISILSAMGHLDLPARTYAWGEIHLDGGLAGFEALLSHRLVAEQQGAEALILPPFPQKLHPQSESLFQKKAASIENCRELYEGLNWKAPSSVPIEFLNSQWIDDVSPENSWDQLKGHPSQFEIASIAALGRHHLFLEGSPGVGKSFWAKALDELQRPLSRDELLSRLEARLSSERELKELKRPFEQPHHSSSMAALVGGGSGRVHLGAISRAHKGILFLDEFPEFNRQAIESLREPLEHKTIRIARSGCVDELPADIQLIAALNPCRCGHFNSKKVCQCGSLQLLNYRNKISGPIRERFHWRLLWRFENQKAPIPFSLRELRARLLSAASQSPRIDPKVLAQIPRHNARALKLELDCLTTYGQWHHIECLSEKDYQRYLELKNTWRLEDPYERF